MLRLFAVLAFFQVFAAAALPQGKLCGSKGIPGFTAYIQVELTEDQLGFRIDGGMHWASCMSNKYTSADGALTLVEPYNDCLQRLVDEKTGGKVPTFKYDEEAKALTASVTTVFSMLPAVDVVFTEDYCETAMQYVTTALPLHSEL